MTDDELRGLLDVSAAETRHHFDTAAGETRRYFDSTLEKTLRHVDATAEETRRYFDVVAEGLRAEVQTVAEGLTTMQGEIDRKFAGVTEEFEETRSLIKLSYSQLDRRIQLLENGQGEHSARIERLEAD